MNQRLVIGTRGSKLALWQAEHVAEQLRDAHPQLDVDVRIIATTGDKILDVPLAKIGDKGLFTKELEVALLDGEVDLCVHSMKDVPSALPEGCALGGMLKRAPAYDVLVLKEGSTATSLDEVVSGARLGTGSLRRTAQLKARFPHIVPTEIRGNVDTRLAKANTPDYDGVILAAAGIARLGYEDRITCALDTSTMVPAVGQGAIGVEIRANDTRVEELLAPIRHTETETCVQAERTILAALEGGCQVPIGAHACIKDGLMHMDAIVLSLDGQRVARSSAVQASNESTDEMVARVLADLQQQGAHEILSTILRQADSHA